MLSLMANVQYKIYSERKYVFEMRNVNKINQRHCKKCNEFIGIRFFKKILCNFFIQLLLTFVIIQRYLHCFLIDKKYHQHIIIYK